MRTITDVSWARRGSSFLWDPSELDRVARPAEVLSIRRLFRLHGAWPDELPSNGGDTLLVAGLDACLDLLAVSDTERWVEQELRPAVLEFQREYEGQAGLVFWLAEGRQRIRTERASDAIRWIGGGEARGQVLDLGRWLWGGAQGDVVRIMAGDEKNQDPEGPAWAGLHLPRLS